MSIFDKIKNGLKKTRDNFTNSIKLMLNSFTKIDDELFEELEEILIMADVGTSTTSKILDMLKAKIKEKGLKDPTCIIDELKEIMAELLSGGNGLELNENGLTVMLIIGVNGVGKTTTIGKFASMFKNEGKKVILGAADTFRAAAIDQLEVWSERADVPLVRQSEGADPAAVVFDTMRAAVARKCDIAICDTAGRLHNKKNLMDELNKISRVIDREASEAKKEVLLVLDATTGRNAVNQAKEFSEAAGITGIVLTKLDGTAKGGVVLAIQDELGIPVKFIGVGEKIDDLQPFIPEDFINGLFEETRN